MISENNTARIPTILISNELVYLPISFLLFANINNTNAAIGKNNAPKAWDAITKTTGRVHRKAIMEAANMLITTNTLNGVVFRPGSSPKMLGITTPGPIPAAITDEKPAEKSPIAKAILALFPYKGTSCSPSTVAEVTSTSLPYKVAAAVIIIIADTPIIIGAII